MRTLCVYTADPYSNVDLTVSTANKPLQSLLFIPFGISHIATSLKEAGHRVRLLVLLEQKQSFRRLIAELDRERPALVSLTAVSSKYGFVKRLAKAIRERSPDSYILIGGNHATLNPDSVAAEECFDAVCVGEGERAVVEVADQLSKGQRPTRINNLWIRSGRQIERNPQDRLVDDISSLPHIDRAMWDEWISDLRFPSVLLGRGCPNRCAYCSNHALSRVSPGKWFRLRSPDDVVREIDEIDRRYQDVETVYLEVETFSADRDYATRLCSALEAFNATRQKPLSFGVNICLKRNMSNIEDLLTGMKRANFRFVNVGLESGSERIRSDVLRRPSYSNENFLEFCDSVRKYGMELNVYVMLGLPEESRDDAQETVDILRRCNPSALVPSVFYPYPGTDLYRKVAEMGLIKGRRFLDGNQERFRARIDYPHMSRWQTQWLLVTLLYRVYAGRWPWRTRAAMTLFSILYVYPSLRSILPKALRSTDSWRARSLREFLRGAVSH